MPMPDFEFRKNPVTGEWVVIAPKRGLRPKDNLGIEVACPFCPVSLKTIEEEVSREGSGRDLIRVIKNKFPFSKYHEIVIHSPDHAKNFEDLSVEHSRRIFEAYRSRYNELKNHGHVYIFHNRGKNAGESLGHAHTQIVVMPSQIPVNSKPLGEPDNNILVTKFYRLYAPSYSQWPGELWVVPKDRYQTFGDLTDSSLYELSDAVRGIIKIIKDRIEDEPAYNFYIYPGKDWYLRLIPRAKVLGGFELASNIYVNTVDPEEVKNYVKEKFRLS
ncbi:MAG: hypothetical protein A3J50_00065 [Candidatus Woykebacteria bacterium RIFCSPHIGHO2_02_FULL_43_16b]|uniref:Galactose-1-phosphate uridyl transferase N-terminal domain-containing protein n=1 Tax=Candidatus Woykebacteria bacterium RIFCSPHIGHO2_02_FULL_43_16b TaxID=1802601 RepID=A0A1G1WNZ6_9BACT|nr:MAG: hypothetical protein A3J50_00065 [Candidatus Woykebacteria bacterium RIFCSPHIGHO2_02_FULL_43_16b]